MASKWENIHFDRWESIFPNSWPYRIFKQYEKELRRYISAFESGKSYVYSQLKNNGATWNALAVNFLSTKSDKTLTVRQWSDNYNELGNFLRLNYLMACSSYVETYIACVIKECVESDPGIIFGNAQLIDGIFLMKKHISVPQNILQQFIVSCTKGTWDERIRHIENILNINLSVLPEQIAVLERMRIIRNNIAHAFGRDIESAQNFNEVKTTSINKLTVKSFNKMHKVVGDLIMKIDSECMRYHIGNFESLYYYHTQFDYTKDMNKGEKMMYLKKSLSANKNSRYSKDFCRGVILYYENL